MLDAVAAVVGIAGAFFVSNTNKKDLLFVGFCCYIFSNLMWIGYGYDINNIWIIAQAIIFSMCAFNGIRNVGKR